MNVKDLKNLYIAHRGIQDNKTIENTIPAFKKALDRNIPIELDIHILKDDTLVVYHDSNLKRLFNIDRDISSYTYLELSKLKYPNTNINIPKLIDVFDLVNGKVPIIIEIKKTNIVSYKYYCRKIYDILKDYSGNFVVKSFDIRIVNWFLKNTNYITGLLIANRRKSIYDKLMQQSITLKVLKPHFISVDVSIVDKKVVKNFRKNNPVLVWTIKSLDILDKVKPYSDSYLIQECYF